MVLSSLAPGSDFSHRFHGHIELWLQGTSFFLISFTAPSLLYAQWPKSTLNQLVISLKDQINS